MNKREVRMRAIEAITGSGIREVARLISDARQIEDWVMAAEDKDSSPRKPGRPKTADK